MNGAAAYSGSTTPPGLELWGGVECTFNRVRDRYFNQLESNGHADMIETAYAMRDRAYAKLEPLGGM